jgi:hypothetical protein
VQGSGRLGEKVHEMKRLGVLVKNHTKAVLAGVTRERPGGKTTPTAAEALPGAENASFWVESIAIGNSGSLRSDH